MYDTYLSKMLRNILLFCAAVAVLGVVLCTVALLWEDRVILVCVGLLFGVVLAAFLVIAAICWIVGRFHAAFSPEGIVYMWGDRVYRTARYSAVKAVTVRGAVDYAYYPIKRSNKKQQAIVSLLKEEHLGPRILPGGVVRFPYWQQDGVLCCAALRQEDLLMIMNGTQATVFVTEDIALLYEAELKPVFEQFPAEKVMVCCEREESRYPAWCTYQEYSGRRQTAVPLQRLKK